MAILDHFIIIYCCGVIGNREKIGMVQQKFDKRHQGRHSFAFSMFFMLLISMGREGSVVLSMLYCIAWTTRSGEVVDLLSSGALRGMWMPMCVCLNAPRVRARARVRVCVCVFVLVCVCAWAHVHLYGTCTLAGASLLSPLDVLS
jgi:hypothetical protein